MKFGITIPTYRRSNGTSFRMLCRALVSVANQTYDDWIVYLIGDRYEDEAEFDDASSLIPPEKLYAVNLPKALERDSGLTGDDLWRCGGVNAMNTALSFQRTDRIDITCHLDDDDFWLANHLETLADAYDNFPQAVFVHTSTHQIVQDPQSKSQFRAYPPINGPTHYGNTVLGPGNFFHSSVSWRLLAVPCNYVANPKMAADAALWTTIGEWCKLHNQKTLHVPKTTVVEATAGRGSL